MLGLLLWLVEELTLVVLLLMLGLLLWLVEELTLVIDFASVSTISLLSDGTVTLVEQELLTLSEHLNSPPDFSGVRVTRSLGLYVCFVDRCLSFCTFFLAIVLSVLLRYTVSDCPFGIFKLFLHQYIQHA